MSRAPRIVFLTALLLTLLFASKAPADEPGVGAGTGGTILLIVDERARALATRVAAELATLGFSVLSRTQEPRTEQLSAEARSAGALAAIWIGPTTQGSVEITVLDRVTGKIVRREVLGRSLEDPTMRELVALRASELLRASLMELEAPHPPRGDVPTSSVVNEVVRSASTSRRQNRRLVLGASGGMLIVPGLSAAPLLQISAGVSASKRLELGFGLGGQLTSSKRFEARGRIETLARWLSVGARFLALPSRTDDAVELSVDVQAMLIALSAVGSAADASDRGQSAFVWAPAGRIGLAARIRLVEDVWWALEPALGFTSAEIALRADHQKLQSWGRPWLEWSTGLELALP